MVSLLYIYKKCEPCRNYANTTHKQNPKVLRTAYTNTWRYGNISHCHWIIITQTSIYVSFSPLLRNSRQKWFINFNFGCVNISLKKCKATSSGNVCWTKYWIHHQSEEKLFLEPQPTRPDCIHMAIKIIRRKKNTQESRIYIFLFEGCRKRIYLPWFCHIQSGPRATRTPGENVVDCVCGDMMYRFWSMTDRGCGERRGAAEKKYRIQDGMIFWNEVWLKRNTNID